MEDKQLGDYNGWLSFMGVGDCPPGSLLIFVIFGGGLFEGAYTRGAYNIIWTISFSILLSFLYIKRIL